VLEDQWTSYYKPSQNQGRSVEAAKYLVSNLDAIPICFLISITFQGGLKDDLFAKLNNFGSSTFGDELQEYLKAPTIAMVQDPIAWWHAIGDTPLARMGRDFMSAPGMCSKSMLFHMLTLAVAILASSCDVEHAFKYQHALSEESTHAATLLNSWSTFPELILEAEIIQVFKDKSQQLGKRKEGSSVLVETTDDGMDLDESSDIEVVG